jgi:amino acid adenylation domain-containing protein
VNSLVEFLSDLRARGVILSVEGDRLLCNAPKGAVTEEMRKVLAARKPEIIDFLRAAANTVPAREPDAANSSPLSRSQQRLWFVSQMDPGNPVYNVVIALGLHGPLHRSAMEQALRSLIDRHESLRTSFHEREGRPWSKLSEQVTWNCSLVDLSAHPPSLAAEEARRLALRESQRGFDLASAPLFRATLFRISATDHLLLLVVHHIVADGWSLGLIAKDLGAFYAAGVAGNQPLLPALPGTYRDYVRWEEQEGARVAEQQLPFWTEQLQGELPIVEIPGDRRRPAQQTFRGRRIAIRVEPELTHRIADLSRITGSTPFMVLLAGFNALLQRYTGLEDILVGSGTSNRQRSEFAPIVGFFVNNLVLRTHLGGNPSFSELLQRVRKTAHDAYAHQEIPFDLLVEKLQPERGSGHSPLVQVFFTFQNLPLQAVDLAGLRVEPVQLDPGIARADLSVEIWPEADGYRCDFEYNTDVYDEETMTAMQAHYLRLLHEAIETPDTPVRDLPLLFAEERRQMLVEWNRTASPYPDLPVHRVFEQHARTAPNAVALLGSDVAISYRELDRRANSIAWKLVERGLPTHSFVAVCAPGTAWGIAAFLGVLKAGHAYLPLEVDDPEERLRSILAAAGAKVLLTTRRDQDRFAGLNGTHCILLDDLLDGARGDSPQCSVEPDDAAYLMFTSGSTGKPKGVVVPHRGIVRLVKNVSYADLGPEETILQLAPLSFDASTFEIWGALLNGGRLVLMSPDQRGPREIADAVSRYDVTTLWLTAALFHFLVAEHIEMFRPLRQLLAGGDVLSPAHVERVLRELPHLRLINGYGPTENTTFTCCHTIRSESLDGRSIPIGRPTENTRVYVLDDRGQPVPRGVAGELLASGDGLALGYLDPPELTTEKFIDLDFDETGKDRAYRTGDLVRFRRDGAVEFLGRRDNQLKLRGHRIEPAEVEQALLALEEIREAVVFARRWSDGDHRLVAAVVTTDSSEIDAQSLRAVLRRTLPATQIPAHFVRVLEVPRTSNGKVDYDALQQLPLDAGNESAAARKPSTDAEKKLAAIFAELLKKEEVFADDDFFAMGGHSLLAMQLTSRINSVFGVQLPVAEIFQLPILESLARHLETSPALAGSRSGQAPANTSPAEHPLSRSQQRLWFLDQLDPGNPVYNIAIAMRLEGHLIRSAMEESLRIILQRHESLRTRFVERDGVPVAVIDDGRNWTLDFVDLSSIPSAELDDTLTRLVTDESQRPYLLDKGPIFRVTLYRKSQQEHVALLGMHHIVSDGWSLGVLAQELGRVYEASVRNRPSPLPPLAVQFRDFVQWESDQQRTSSGTDLQYWRKQLDGELPQLALPLDRPRPPLQSFRGHRLFGDLPTDLEKQLLALARRQNATFFMVLLAAFGVLLRQFTRQDDILIGTPTAGRLKSSFEGLIGFFVNNLVLRTDLSGDPSFAELVHRIRGVSLEAFEHQSTPFDQLVELVQPERTLDRSPLFQVMFTLQNANAALPQLEGIAISPMEFQGFRARYDLAVDVYPYEGHFRCDFEFNTDLFEETTIQRMLDHYLHILQMVSADATQPIHKLQLLDEPERRQLIETWNQTAAPPVPWPTVPAWFAAQASATPASPAVSMGGRVLTYSELDAQSSALAAALRSHGVGRSDIVALFLERSPEMVIGVLGILKAGAAYLPLDPALPAQRIEFLLADAAAPLILTQRELRGALPATNSTVLAIEEVGAASSNGLAEQPSADDLAYMIYTSGSTGNPKGTEISHAALVNLLASMLREPGLSASDTFVAVTTLSFDIATLEVLGPLLCGAKLVIASREQVIDPEQLTALLDSSQATVMQATPSTWRMLVESGWLGRPALRMWCGGEALAPDLAESMMARGSELWNLYGPTETTIWSAAHRVRSGENPILIGRPIANTQMYILDENLQPVPIGVAGELFIGGHGVARGYRGRPELTATRFLTDPFDPAQTRRMYRTGDLARYRSDGEILLLGRTDHQIKLRGHRIEPGEIEAVIERHPSVRQAVVVLDGKDSNKQLVAYIRYAEAAGDVDQIRAWLRERLPDYMVPAVLMPLDEFPMTPNGKIDRKRLPSPLAIPRESRGDSIAARNQTEQRLSELWSDTLHVERPGVHDNFFDLGGHSLLLVQLHARLKREFNTNIAVVDLFRYPTIETLASFLDRKSASSSPVTG